MLKKKMMKRRKKILSSDEEIDPMIYAVNMIDCMLVLAVGFLIFTIIFMNSSPQEVSKTVDLKLGKEVNVTSENSSSSSSNGLTQLGTVYKDPKTGKTIMINNT
ncbi:MULTISPECIES: DUF2149 domain-containing protein [Methanobacterium]|jgi:hypothetical protein|uniref:DUF2149 domain-containing protein n=1 Tax=Methanobacterium bryantii TaxID=2161 RepID=A0A2A2H1J1_METBR|nr:MULTISPECIES: DUF2149 domain-containing protein [Methanobacterium]OEC84288.1 hypothetical protein A9507_02610 [Methanobacterium sp. A39]PAV03247.1 hypothetical protein ASJ80_04400 [Methanobacterium bryantii]